MQEMLWWIRSTFDFWLSIIRFSTPNHLILVCDSQYRALLQMNRSLLRMNRRIFFASLFNLKTTHIRVFCAFRLWVCVSQYWAPLRVNRALFGFFVYIKSGARQGSTLTLQVWTHNKGLFCGWFGLCVDLQGSFPGEFCLLCVCLRRKWGTTVYKSYQH